jgi:hypothetical protein
MRRTCPKSEYLTINNEIEALAKEVLTIDQILEAEELASDLVSKSTRRIAINKLQEMTGMRPKRPLYYLNFELNGLPYRTRDSVRYVGDYIDLLVKLLASDLLSDSRCLSISLGGNLKKLKTNLNEPLYSNLVKYNTQVYTPAKHEFKVEKNRKHLFTSKEVVYIILISLHLKEKIIEISTEAKNYSEDS